MRKYKRPLNRSITVGCIVFLLLLCLLLSVANLTLYKNYVYDDYRGYIADLLGYAMSRIDADDLKICIDTLTESDKYKETLLFLDDLMEHYDDIHYLYAVRPLNTDDTGSVLSVLSAERYYDRYIDTEGNLYLGWISDDEYDSETASQLFDIMNGDDIVYFHEETEWGVDYTGAMPIKTTDGESIAVLAVDVDLSFINKMILNYALVNVLIIVAMGVLFIGIFLIWSRRNITMPIKKLEQSAVGFVGHSHGQRDVDALRFDAPNVTSDNEIKALSDAVVKMTQDMRDYVTDIISAERKAADLHELANTDALTGVGNKTAYDREIRRLQGMLSIGHSKVGLAIADLNFLKVINDTYGHEKGNVALVKLCDLICETFTHSKVFRIGGDEFVIILHGEDYTDYDRLMESFNNKLAAMSADSSLEPWEKISAAVGAAFYDASIDENFDGLFRRADHVMYDRKKEMKAVRQ